MQGIMALTRNPQSSADEVNARECPSNLSWITPRLHNWLGSILACVCL